MPTDETTQSSPEPTPDAATSQTDAPVRRTRRRAASRPAGPPQPSSPSPDVVSAPSGTTGSAPAPEVPVPAAKKPSSRRSSKKTVSAPSAPEAVSAVGRGPCAFLRRRSRGACPGPLEACEQPKALVEASGREPVRRGRGCDERWLTQRDSGSSAEERPAASPVFQAPDRVACGLFPFEPGSAGASPLTWPLRLVRTSRRPTPADQTVPRMLPRRHRPRVVEGRAEAATGASRRTRRVRTAP